MNTKIILIRHAQSLKNIKDIHGGDGERLTFVGKEQANHLVDILKGIGVQQNNAVIIHSMNIQVKETADILSSKLNIAKHYISDFAPLHLGVVHGLSNEVVAMKYPQEYEALLKWRRREIEICDLAIPEMDNPIDFYNRGLNILSELQEEKYNIFIATNSLYILLLNILLGNTCKKGGGYKHFDIPNCGITMFEKNRDGSYDMNLELSDVPSVISYKLESAKSTSY